MYYSENHYIQCQPLYAQFTMRQDNAQYLIALKRNPLITVRISAVDYKQITRFEKSYAQMLLIYDVLLIKNYEADKAEGLTTTAGLTKPATYIKETEETRERNLFNT